MTYKKTFVFLVMVLVGLSCRTTDTITSLRATATALPTRTVRPTYTSTPLTVTLLPTVTIAPVTAQTRTPTRKPTTATSTRAPVLPTTAPIATKASGYQYRVDSIYCLHSGGAFGNGFVLENPDHRSGIDGMRVRMSTSPGGAPVAPDAITENKYMMNEYYSEGGLEGGFSHIINANGPANGEIRYFWIVDGNGNPLSDPSKAKVTYSNRPDDHACWESIVTFIKN